METKRWERKQTPLTALFFFTRTHANELLYHSTVSAPVYDRSVQPPLFLGVVAVDSYIDALEQILGEDATSFAMLQRFVLLSTAHCPKIKLSECELDALRFIGGGLQATCGKCNNTVYAGIVPEKCPLQGDLPNNLWQNTHREWFKFLMICCRGLDILLTKRCLHSSSRRG